eukprot:TRINITY_DN5554_c0_g1_i1.p1 TRINITY_DN5554_c0_g1~~TRINITY_DN5554_c0_g1_i1.p1  ORF type:complete len:1168 (-),score=161.62 TRINITY_DN5554_c0_g1_i1:57-3539(-)
MAFFKKLLGKGPAQASPTATPGKYQCFVDKEFIVPANAGTHLAFDPIYGVLAMAVADAIVFYADLGITYTCDLPVTGFVSALTFAPSEGAILAVAAGDARTVVLLDLVSKRATFQHSLGSETVTALHNVIGTPVILCGTSSGTVFSVDARARCLTTFEVKVPDSGAVLLLEAHPEDTGYVLALCALGSTPDESDQPAPTMLVQLDSLTGVVVARYSIKSELTVTRFVVSPDGKYIFATCSTGVILAWKFAADRFKHPPAKPVVVEPLLTFNHLVSGEDSGIRSLHCVCASKESEYTLLGYAPVFGVFHLKLKPKDKSLLVLTVQSIVDHSLLPAVRQLLPIPDAFWPCERRTVAHAVVLNEDGSPVILQFGNPPIFAPLNTFAELDRSPVQELFLLPYPQEDSPDLAMDLQWPLFASASCFSNPGIMTQIDLLVVRQRNRLSFFKYNGSTAEICPASLPALSSLNEVTACYAIENGAFFVCTSRTQEGKLIFWLLNVALGTKALLWKESEENQGHAEEGNVAADVARALGQSIDVTSPSAELPVPAAIRSPNVVAMHVAPELARITMALEDGTVHKVDVRDGTRIAVPLPSAVRATSIDVAFTLIAPPDEDVKTKAKPKQPVKQSVEVPAWCTCVASATGEVFVVDDAGVVVASRRISDAPVSRFVCLNPAQLRCFPTARSSASSPTLTINAVSRGAAIRIPSAFCVDLHLRYMGLSLASGVVIKLCGLFGEELLNVEIVPEPGQPPKLRFGHKHRGSSFQAEVPIVVPGAEEAEPDAADEVLSISHDDSIGLYVVSLGEHTLATESFDVENASSSFFVARVEALGTDGTQLAAVQLLEQIEVVSVFSRDPLVSCSFDTSLPDVPTRTIAEELYSTTTVFAASARSLALLSFPSLGEVARTTLTDPVIDARVFPVYDRLWALTLSEGGIAAVYDLDDLTCLVPVIRHQLTGNPLAYAILGYAIGDSVPVAEVMLLDGLQGEAFHCRLRGQEETASPLRPLNIQPPALVSSATSKPLGQRPAAETHKGFLKFGPTVPPLEAVLATYLKSAPSQDSLGSPGSGLQTPQEGDAEARRKELMGADYSATRQTQGGKPGSVQGAQGAVSETMEIMAMNRQALLERGEKISKLSDRTEEMQNAARDFAESCRRLNAMHSSKKWYQL